MNKRISFDKETSWEQENGIKQVNFRFNIITILVYAIGIILIAQLFNLQVVHGESYRQQSNTRLSRISKIDSVRGSILDRSGTELAGIRAVNNVEIYKTNVSDDELNTAILKLVNLLNEQQATYTDTFPVKISPFENGKRNINFQKIQQQKRHFINLNLNIKFQQIMLKI